MDEILNTEVGEVPANETMVERSAIDILKDTGSITLKAKTREELAAKVKELKESSDVKLSFGAVGQKRGNGIYTIRIDILKN